jgi:hypothetical protein
LLTSVTQREFEIYALSLSRGPNFGPYRYQAGWKSHCAVSVGAVLADNESRRFAAIVLRRQVDHRFTLTFDAWNLVTPDDAANKVAGAMRPEEAADPLPSGVRRRRLLIEPGGKEAGDHFKLLTGTVTHLPALMAVGEVYLAMPRPDDNFASDFRTANFDSRLWELYLVAAFREQGIAVLQDHPSPDFLIEREGHCCYVEAVTTNPLGARVQGFSEPTFAPEDRKERMVGAPAVRFAKSLRSKMQRQYEAHSHVRGKPFTFAIADFHAPSSMVWSREALPSYLYGEYADVEDGPDGPHAIARPVDTLLGEDQIRAGLFNDPEVSYLSAVIFSNSATLGKFNRMGFLAGWRPPGLTMVREGLLFDRTPGALQPIPFRIDILSAEYQALWPWGEAWCQELEVFHNPLAAYPLNFDLIPGATHWFKSEGEIVCSSIWEWSVLSSLTHLNLER